MKIKYIILLFIFTQLNTVYAGETTSNLEEEIYTKFIEYLCIVRESTDVSRFFSSETNQYWLNNIFKNRENIDEVISVLSSMKARALFGKRLKEISNFYFESETGKPIIYFFYRNSKGYYNKKIVYYAKDNEEWKISKVGTVINIENYEHSEFNSIEKLCLQTRLDTKKKA